MSHSYRSLGGHFPIPGVDALGVEGVVDTLKIRKRLGRHEWGPPELRDDGAGYVRNDQRRTVIVSAATYPDDPTRTVWIHASIACHPIDVRDLPGYEDLKTLHRAVWPNGWAIQVFAPPAEHIDFTPVLHLWGRADGARIHPDFAWMGAI